MTMPIIIPGRGDQRTYRQNMWDKSIKPSQSVNKKEFIMSKRKIYRDWTLQTFSN